MMLHVQVVLPDEQPQFHTFCKAEVLIGRKPDNDLVLADRDVSGTHACLQVEAGRVMLFDLRSTNGTFVNGERIPVSTPIGPDDEVTISIFTLRASLTEIHPTAPLESLAPQPLPPEPPPPHDIHAVAPLHAKPPARPSQLDDDGPPLARDPSPSRSLATGFDTDGLPPVVARPRQSAILAPAPVQTPVAAPRTPAPELVVPAALANLTNLTSLAHAWHDPTVRRIFIVGLQRVEVERDGVRLPLMETFPSSEALFAQLTALCAHAVPCTTSERVLADGTVIQATTTSEVGPYVVITRPRNRCVITLDTLVHDHILPLAAAELLSACTRARLPVLLAALPGAAAAGMLAALLATTAGPSALVRGLPAPIVTPRDCTAFDASHGEGRMAATVRLALAGDVQWLGVDEPEAAALDECAWAAASGCGVVVGLRAESLPHALRRARAIGAGADGPAIPYALVALLAPASETGDTSADLTSLRWLGELRPGDGPNNVHELFTTGRRGNLIATAVPKLLGDLSNSGIHLAPELFTLA